MTYTPIAYGHSTAGAVERCNCKVDCADAAVDCGRAPGTFDGTFDATADETLVDADGRLDCGVSEVNDPPE